MKKIVILAFFSTILALAGCAGNRMATAPDWEYEVLDLTTANNIAQGQKEISANQADISTVLIDKALNGSLPAKPAKTKAPAAIKNQEPIANYTNESEPAMIDMADLNSKIGSPAQPKTKVKTTHKWQLLSDAQQGHMANLRIDIMRGPKSTGFNWDSGQTDLGPVQIKELETVVGSVPPGAKLVIHLIEGRTDRIGTEGKNRALAEQRGLAVEKWLKERRVIFAPDYERISRPVDNQKDGYIIYSFQ
jgi:outer membrane protein OmpA-like peptidoglycan-associated protein